MKPLILFLNITMLFSASALAETPLDLTFPTTNTSNQASPLVLAAVDKSIDGESNPGVASFKEKWMTSSKLHQYLGLGSLGFAALSAISPKPGKDDDFSTDPHHQFANAAAVLGGAAVASGLAFHYKDFNWRNLMDPDTLHILLGTIAATGFILAVDEAPDSGHADTGMTSFAVMAVAIKITW